MSRKTSRVPGTLAVRQSRRGPVRALHSAEKPVCEKCGHSDHVVRLWHGGVKVWVCSEHYRIKSTKKKEATLMQRVLHRLPEADEFGLNEVLVNRRHRRRQG